MQKANKLYIIREESKNIVIKNEKIKEYKRKKINGRN